MVRELIGVMKREGAAMGVFITVEKPTEEMRRAAMVAGSYSFNGRSFPRVQLVTAEDLLGGRVPEVPAVGAPAGFRRTSLAALDRNRAEQMVLPKVTDPLLVDKAIAREAEEHRIKKLKATREEAKQRRADDDRRAHLRPA
jgi:hypothetical protein